ncbi:RadC family protein [Salinicoccus siamensis]|uniref:RadC family protein n=1 Tax=Salinicoccus siamensis TaxID=381830 RepID=A0ABV5Z434_9STAP
METLVVSKIKLSQQARKKKILNDSFNKITCPEDAFMLANHFLKGDVKESLLVLSLNIKNHVEAVYECFSGTLNAAAVSPREIYQFALLNNSAAIIVLHNHPSGDTTPSEADIDFTKQLNMAGTLIDIDFLDHIIVSDSEYTSVREKRPDVLDVCSNSRLELFVADGNEHYSKNK